MPAFGAVGDGSESASGKNPSTRAPDESYSAPLVLSVALLGSLSRLKVSGSHDGSSPLNLSVIDLYVHFHSQVCQGIVCIQFKKKTTLFFEF